MLDTACTSSLTATGEVCAAAHLVSAAADRQRCVPAARWFFQQLVMAVSYCHAMGVVNRDIKVRCPCVSGSVAQPCTAAASLCKPLTGPSTQLENALLEDLKRPILKLSDFGYSKHERDSRPKTWVGTPGYTGALACLPGTAEQHLLRSTQAPPASLVSTLACQALLALSVPAGTAQLCLNTVVHARPCCLQRERSYSCACPRAALTQASPGRSAGGDVQQPGL